MDTVKIPKKFSEKGEPKGKSIYVTNSGHKKRKIGLALCPEIYEKFVKTVVEIEGSPKAIGKVLEYLMLKYVEDASKPGTLPVRLTTQERLRKILEYIASKRGVELSNLLYSEVLESELAEAIKYTIGSDKRTVEKYLQLLVETGVIAYIGGINPKRIYEVKRIL